MRFLRRPVTAVLSVVLLLVLGGLAWAMTTPSGYYVFWPDEAHPAVDYVHVPGGKPPAGRCGFYFVDVHETSGPPA
jgi:hypothetical protein